MPTEADTLADFTRHPKWFPYDKHVSHSYLYDASITAVTYRCGPRVLATPPATFDSLHTAFALFLFYCFFT